MPGSGRPTRPECALPFRRVTSPFGTKLKYLNVRYCAAIGGISDLEQRSVEGR